MLVISSFLLLHKHPKRQNWLLLPLIPCSKNHYKYCFSQEKRLLKCKTACSGWELNWREWVQWPNPFSEFCSQRKVTNKIIQHLPFHTLFEKKNHQAALYFPNIISHWQENLKHTAGISKCTPTWWPTLLILTHNVIQGKTWNGLLSYREYLIHASFLGHS